MTNQSKKHTTVNTNGQSALQKFNLAFEYNVPWKDAGQTVQLRPNKK